MHEAKNVCVIGHISDLKIGLGLGFRLEYEDDYELKY